MPESPALYLASAVQCLLVLLGTFCLWRFVLRPAAREKLRQSPELAPWEIALPDFLTYVLGTICGALVGMFLFGAVVGALKVSNDAKLVFGTAGMQLGLLIGPAFMPLRLRREPTWTAELRRSLSSGLIVFFIAIPLIYGATAGWIALLDLCGVPIEKQEVMDLLLKTKSTKLIICLGLMASILAPMAEELFFRGMLFRYLRGRVPRWVALLAPSVFFAALHVNWETLNGFASVVPLVLLAVIFSLAYERTGRIGTTIVAHGLFNLHSIVLVLLGIGS